MTQAKVPWPIIAILGAESTGKTDLASALADALSQRGLPCTLVPEYLREWCSRNDRTPRPHEQSAIAQEQSRRIAEASTHGWVVADTTSLMTAIYSDLLFDDLALYDDALRSLSKVHATLVTALDLPWVADGLQRDGPQVREPVDALLRAALQRGSIDYSVVHGSGAERLANALRALGLGLEASPASAQTTTSTTFACDKCSDPDCEHRLFTRLLSGAR